MKLTDLHPRFIRATGRGAFVEESEADIASADGIAFLCPKCFADNQGPKGTHTIICWRPHVRPEIRPSPGRWSWEGTSFADLTLKAGSSSVLLLSGCRAHFYVRGGQIIMT